jgi:anti-sigma factor RsiW
MSRITHKQAQEYINASTDGLLKDAEKALLDAHLAECSACQLQAENLNRLGKRLESGFRARWDTENDSSKITITNIKSQSRKVIMTNRIIFGIKAFAGLCALIILGAGFNSFIIKAQNFSNSTIVPAAEQTSTSKLNQRWYKPSNGRLNKKSPFHRIEKATLKSM